MKNLIIFVLFCLSLLIFGCGDGGNSGKTADNGNDSGRETGSLYGECYPNETCNKGLECDVENNICIKKTNENNNDQNDSENDNSDTMPDEDNDISDTLSEQNDDNVDTEDDSDNSITDDSDSAATTPCKPNPCVNVENSTGTCTPIDETRYFCWCKANYTWDSSTKTCRDDYFEENDDDDVVNDIDNDYGCTAGKYKCSGTNSMICSDGYWELDEYCAYGCDSSTGKCKSSECTTGEYKCSAVGSYYSYSQYCNDGLWGTDQICEGECDSSTGKCKDVCYNIGNKIWSSKAKSYMKWEEAVEYCNNLTHCGYSDWHLPTINELRTLIQNCSNTESGGECGVTDSCLSSSKCRNDACDGCSSDSTGKYSKLGDRNDYWSSSVRSDATNSVWIIDFEYYGEVESRSKTDSWTNVRCVRNAD